MPAFKKVVRALQSHFSPRANPQGASAQVKNTIGTMGSNEASVVPVVVAGVDEGPDSGLKKCCWS